MEITKAEYIDLEQILKLQYLAYQSEAELYHNYNIPPLLQTLEDLQKEYQSGIVLKAIEADTIIGSVRGYTKADTLYIGKLIVHPDYQGRGLGTKLLISLEEINILIIQCLRCKYYFILNFLHVLKYRKYRSG
jgi:GNAT superfamily N-acetyltransferase